MGRASHEKHRACALTVNRPFEIIVPAFAISDPKKC
jgi:hypothetical protein